MATLKGRHRQNRMWSCGWSRAGSETTPEEKQIMHDVLFREIVNIKGPCLTWASMGSKVCRRHAEAMGWHGKEWGSAAGVFPMTEATSQRVCGGSQRVSQREVPHLQRTAES